MMFSKRSGNAVVGDFRPSRKCFSFYGSLLFLVLLCLTQQATGRPSQDDDEMPSDFNVGDQFADVDNVEIHHVKVVDGVAQQDHPIIMYKEDFVNEDYVPSKNETNSDKPKRRYKDISQRRRQRQHKTEEFIEEKPEKMLFDIIPQAPLIVAEDLVKPRKSHMKLIPLVDDVSEAKESNELADSKSSLNKRPKKYHHRVRRDLSEEHQLRKRNPYFRHFPKVAGDAAVSIQYVYVKHSVPGKKHNGLDLVVTKAPTTVNTNTKPEVPISFGTRVGADDDDRVIIPNGRTTPRPTSRPVESIFRDPRPENFDFSFMNPQATTSTSRPIFNRPTTTTESIFRDPRPENFDFSFMNQGQQTQQSNVFVRPATTAPAPPPPPARAEPTVTQCVWAIVNCCSNRSNNVRYSCFEENGCYGAFWDINPCADNIRDSVVGFVADYYN